MPTYTAGGAEEVAQTGGRFTTAVAASTAADTVIKASAGVLHSVLLTAAGTANITIYDNASTHSGTIVAIIPSAATVNGVPYVLNMPCANGITVGGNALNGAITVSYS